MSIVIVAAIRACNPFRQLSPINCIWNTLSVLSLYNRLRTNMEICNMPHTREKQRKKQRKRIQYTRNHNNVYSIIGCVPLQGSVLSVSIIHNTSFHSIEL